MFGKLAYWAVFAATMAIYATMLIWTLPSIAENAGGLVPFDMRPTGYSPDEARIFLSALNETGRSLYLGTQHTLDLVYPMLLAIVLSGGVVALIANWKLRGVLYLAILLGMFADYTENTFVALMLEYPGPVPDKLAGFASMATVIKSALTGFAMVVLIGALALAAKKRWIR